MGWIGSTSGDETESRTSDEAATFQTEDESLQGTTVRSKDRVILEWIQ